MDLTSSEGHDDLVDGSFSFAVAATALDSVVSSGILHEVRDSIEGGV